MAWPVAPAIRVGAGALRFLLVAWALAAAADGAAAKSGNNGNDD